MLEIKTLKISPMGGNLSTPIPMPTDPAVRAKRLGYEPNPMDVRRNKMHQLRLQRQLATDDCLISVV